MSSSRIRKGDICLASASIVAPLYDFLANDELSFCSTDTRIDHEKMESNEFYAGKNRPCVVTDFDEETGLPIVCFFATFGGADVRAFPTLLKQFLVPVNPAEDHSADEVLPFHTQPEWIGPPLEGDPSAQRPQWILAYEYTTGIKHVISRKWESSYSDPAGQTFAMSREEVKRLMLLCESKRNAYFRKRSRVTIMADEQDLIEYVNKRKNACKLPEDFPGTQATPIDTKPSKASSVKNWRMRTPLIPKGPRSLFSISEDREPTSPTTVTHRTQAKDGWGKRAAFTELKKFGQYNPLSEGSWRGSETPSSPSPSSRSAKAN